MERIKTMVLSVFVALLVCSPLIVYRHSHPVHAHAQTQVHNNPDCQFFFSATAPGQVALPFPSGNGFDNRKQGCNIWAMSFSTSGFSHRSVTLQSAADTGTGAGAWGTGFPVQQTIIDGSNPMIVTIGGFVEIVGTNAFVRAIISTGATSTGGFVTGTVFGWRIPNAQ